MDGEQPSPKPSPKGSGNWLVLLVGLAAAVAATAAVWFFWPPAKQTARSLLHLASVPPKIIFDVGGKCDFEMFQRSQAALIKSRFVLNAALQEPGMRKLSCLEERPDPVQWLENEIQVDFSIGPEILRISLQGDNPQELVSIVDAVTKVYLRDIVNRESSTRLDRIDLLKKLYRKYEGKIEDKKQKLRDLVEVVNLGDSHNLKQKIALKQLDLAMNELAQVHSEVRKLEAKISLHTKVPGTTLDRLDELKKLHAGYKKRIQAKKQALNELALLAPVAAGNGNSDDLDLKKKTTLKEVDLAVNELARVDSEIRKLEEERDTLQSPESLPQLRREKAFLEKLEKLLERDVERLARVTQISNANLDLSAINEDLAILNATFNSVLKEINTLEVEREAPPRIRLLEDAVVSPPEKDQRRLLMSGLAGFGTLVLFFLGSAWWTFRSRTVAGLTGSVNR